MFSNGQQTLGVALPWAIAACLANPGGKVISVSGDGGFLFSAVELETAVRLNCDFVHLVWIDGSYNMPDQVAPVLRQALEMAGPVIVGVPVDYRDNPGLMAALHDDVLH